jgi:iron complex transport system substrate-binding protein
MLAGCIFQKTPEAPVVESPDQPVVVYDDMDRAITIPKLPTRIVSLAPANTELIFALGLGDKVVGVTEYCNYPEEAAGKEKIGDFFSPSVEKIVSLNPDLVLAASLHKTVVEQLDELKIPTLVLDALSIADVFGNLDMLGKATNTAVQADEVKSYMQSILDEVTRKVASIPGEAKPLVYYEIWGDPITTSGPDTFVHELIALGGGLNMAADASEKYPVYSLEELLAKKPAIMFYGHGAESIEQVLARPDWGSIPAIQENRVYLVNDDIMFRPAPRLVEGLLAMAKLLHPELWD